jgi:tripartite-type tricarboxylate transporter receptor subunit TctC
MEECVKNYKYLFLLIFLSFSGMAQAQTYPAKAVRLIVPFAAGGSTDIIGRIVGQKLSETWGQPVVIDNRPGGSTVIGTDIVAKSAPDGHTLLVTPAPFTIVPGLISKLPYDPHKDFEPIALINTTPLVIVVNPGVPAKSVKELIALARAKPGMLNFGSSGSGGSNHLAGELFNAMAGTRIVHIPDNRNAPALADLVRIMKSPDLIEKLKSEGSDPVGSTVEQYQHFLRDEIVKWDKVIKFAGVKSL